MASYTQRGTNESSKSIVKIIYGTIITSCKSQHNHYRALLQVLSLSQADISSITSGYVINLIASDLQRFELSALSIFLFVQALFELCGISCVISFLFGWKALTGILFMIIISLYYGITGRILTNLRSKISKVADHRINIMNSIISGIRAVKMYAWEWPFMERVQRIRR